MRACDESFLQPAWSKKAGRSQYMRGLPVWAAAVLASVVLLGSSAPSTASGKFVVKMSAKAFLAKCETDIRFCSDQIAYRDIDDMLDRIEKKQGPRHCMPSSIKQMPAAERQTTVVSAMRAWFARHPEEVTAKGEATGTILKALDQIWPCK